MVSFGEVRRAQLVKSTLLTSTLVPWDLCRSFKVCSDTKERERERDAESNGELPHLSIPSKIAAWVPEFVVEDPPLSRTAAWELEFAVKNLSLGRTL